LRSAQEQHSRPAVHPPGGRRAGARRLGASVLAAGVIGVGLIAAPVVFQMFSRAPAGGQMIDQFRPFMTRAEVARLRGFLAEISSANTQAQARVDPQATRQLGVNEAAYRQHLQYLAAFETRWPGINADMTDMLNRMHANLGNFGAVDALPPFPLFPWFFVVPGLFVAGTAGWALSRRRRGAPSRAPIIVLAVLGLALIAAPAVFQMFSRAPRGGRMIDDFRPLMTRHKVTTIQGYFITIGNGEAELRTTALPAAAPPAGSVPAVDRFVADWPRIDREMAPVIGVMSDNVTNFQAVDALPPFPLFPWFFVVPGLLIIGLAGLAWRSQPPEPVGSPATSQVSEGRNP
jgi:hypothetical protein